MKKILLLLWFVVSLVGCASMPRTADIPAANATQKIYVIYRGWHTSILLDAKKLAEQSPLLAPELVGQKYARIGWGDGDYFTGKNKSTASAAKALVASGYSAVQLLVYDDEPFDEIPADTRAPVMITDQGLKDLIAYVNQSIARDARGQLLRLPAFGVATGSFFQSTEHYSAFSNCNTWTGAALRKAGLPVANRLTSRGVFEQVQAISMLQAARGQFNL